MPRSTRTTPRSEADVPRLDELRPAQACDASALRAAPPERGSFVDVRVLDVASNDLAKLHEAFDTPEADKTMWTWLMAGPFPTVADLAVHVAPRASPTSETDVTMVVVDKEHEGKLVGFACYLAIEPAHRSVEIGFVCFSPVMQRSRMSTEALVLMIRRAFEAGFHRVEWKTNCFNEPSQRCAARLGMTYEGRHAQSMIVRGRSRDTDWFSITKPEWAAQDAVISQWLSRNNFSATGEQRESLDAIRVRAGVSRPVPVEGPTAWQAPHRRPPPMQLNEAGKPLGPVLQGWVPPNPQVLVRGRGVDVNDDDDAGNEGAWVRLVPVASVSPPERQAKLEELFASMGNDDDAVWRHLSVGPFDSLDAFTKAMDADEHFGVNPPPPRSGLSVVAFFVVSRASNRAEGLAAYRAINPSNAVVELGPIIFSRGMQRSPKSTETLWLLTRRAVKAGFRRVQWRCSSVNESSRTCAVRLGFVFEGTQAMQRTIKGKSHDMDWFSVLPDEWASWSDAPIQTWLSRENFDVDAEGNAVQRESLASIRARCGVRVPDVRRDVAWYEP